ncbi:MAG: NAD-dependent epimerase/dehydratase family protein [Trueperaceae bacterium]|nr:NAD-dependent epimerase/dehydratase family protein [Trueperaceae bacterium]
MASSRVLVTGGAGFLGHTLVQLLAAWNRSRPSDAVDLLVADNYARGMPEWLAVLDGHDDVRCLRHDVTQPLPGGVGAHDWVVHAASIASPTFYRKHPLETMDANVHGLRLLLDRAVAQAASGDPLSGFLFFSTSEIYGDPTPDMIPTPETYRGNVSCTGPRACYDESKRYGETLSVTFARQYGVPVKIVRPFNNYGPGLNLHDGRVLPDFARNVLAGRDVVMHSDGSPTRTFCYVEDAMVGYVRALVRGRDGEPYNIGVREPEISMLDLAERVVAWARDAVGYTGRVVHQASEERDYLVDNPNRRCPVIDKAVEELDYDPQVRLDDGLDRAMTWYAGTPAPAGPT